MNKTKEEQHDERGDNEEKASWLEREALNGSNTRAAERAEASIPARLMMRKNCWSKGAFTPPLSQGLSWLSRQWRPRHGEDESNERARKRTEEEKKGKQVKHGWKFRKERSTDTERKRRLNEKEREGNKAKRICKSRWTDKETKKGGRQTTKRERNERSSSRLSLRTNHRTLIMRPWTGRSVDRLTDLLLDPKKTSKRCPHWARCCSHRQCTSQSPSPSIWDRRCGRHPTDPLENDKQLKSHWKREKREMRKRIYEGRETRAIRKRGMRQEDQTTWEKTVRNSTVSETLPWVRR